MKQNFSSEQLIVALDIGTTKICALVAHIYDHDTFEIIGIGKSPSQGLEKGIVTDVNKTVHSIKSALKEAELMAGCTIEQATIGISGAHIQSRTSLGMVPITRGEIKPHDVLQATAAARAIALPEGQQILHALPQFFVIDGHEKVIDPLGMFGVRLEAHVHIITGSVASVHNLVKCCELAGIMVNDIVLEQLASAHAVLTPDEKFLGVGMLDIGGGTSDLALYQKGTIKHTMVLPIAGNHFTNDIAIGLRTTLKSAEAAKKEFGIVDATLIGEDACLEIEAIGQKDSRIILQSELLPILRPRAQELLSFIDKECKKHHLYHAMPSGMVLTGGGALLKGIDRVASSLFGIPVRIGTPQLQSPFSLLLENPMYATAYGLLLHAAKKQDTYGITKFSGPFASRIINRMKSWVSEFF